MVTPSPIGKEKIVSKLDTFRLVLEANRELFEADPIVKEQLDVKMQLAQGFLDALDVWEKSGDQMDYDFALESAQAVIANVQNLINHKLDR